MMSLGMVGISTAPMLLNQCTAAAHPCSPTPYLGSDVAVLHVLSIHPQLTRVGGIGGHPLGAQSIGVVLGNSDNLRRTDAYYTPVKQAVVPQVAPC